MRFRRLQSLDDDGQQWLDEAYVYETTSGTIRLRYNPMVWEGIGARHNRQFEAEGTSLATVETVILAGDRLRWLEVEELEGEPETLKAMLDKQCRIPRPQKRKIEKQAAV